MELVHWCSGATLDRHLADQLLLPLAFTSGPLSYSAQAITQHLRSNAFVIERFGLAEVRLSAGETGTGIVNLTPALK